MITSIKIEMPIHKMHIIFSNSTHVFLKKAPPATVVVIAVARSPTTAIVVVIIIIAPLQLLKDHVVEDVCLDISCGYCGRHCSIKVISV